jgi:hypothetical protein
MMTVAVGLIGFTAGMSVSGFRHYYYRYADGKDLRTNYVQEVVVVEDETKKRRGKK